MGREYWHWGSGSRRKKGDQKAEGRRERGQVILEEEEEIRGSSGLPNGCMCAVFQLFDNFQLAPSSSSSSSSTTTAFKPASFLVGGDHRFNIPKGTEAPRNSLELEEPSFPISTGKENKPNNLDIPMGIQIKTRAAMGDHKRSTSKALKGGLPSSETLTNGDSPSTKTPTLVARLMGLDLLPDPSSSSSPSSPSSSRSHRHPPIRRPTLQARVLAKSNRTHDDPSGTRSLPETPRVSSSSSRRSDVDQHHRLSLQINKENVAPSCEEVPGLSRILTRRDQNLVEEKKCTSPGKYARQIVKQVKESVSRRVGLDITNNVSNTRKAAGSSPSEVNHLNDEAEPGKVLTCRPRKSHEDNKENDVNDGKRSKFSSASRSKQTRRLPIQRETTDVIKNKQEEPFVRRRTRSNGGNNPDKKPKRMIMPLSSNMTQPNSLLPVKRDRTPPATKIPNKQAPNGHESKWSSQLSRCSNQPYKLQEATRVCTTRMNNSNTSIATLHTGSTNLVKSNGLTSAVALSVATRAATNNRAAECDYITRVLKRNGVDTNSHVSFTRWFSSSHPLDPSIFYYLEHFTDVATAHPGQLSQRNDRKLLFHLVDEILVDILRPRWNSNPWVGPSLATRPCQDPVQMKGSELVGLLCTKVRSFPSVDCRVLDDIDGLIDGDMRCPLVGPSEPGFEEEEDGLVSQVERDILDTLVHEVAVFLWSGRRRQVV